MKLLRGSRVTFLDRGRDLMKRSTNSKNKRQYSVLEGFWHAGGSGQTLSEPLLLVLMLSWAMLGRLGIILRQRSGKMRQSWSQDEVQDRQDVPAWSARGPLVPVFFLILLLFIVVVHLLLEIVTVLSFGPLTIVKFLLGYLFKVIGRPHVYSFIFGLLKSSIFFFVE